VFKLHRKQTNIKHLTKTVPDREKQKQQQWINLKKEKYYGRM
jgi:hypothetical protein